MKVILLKDVQKVGRKFDVKNVADGFAANMLLPRGLAKIATPQAMKEIETMKKADMAERQMEMDLLSKNLATIKGLTIQFKEKANDKGHLFAGVTREALAQEILKAARLNIPPESIQLEKPLKEIGEHKVKIEALGKSAEFTVVIEAK